MKTFLSAAVCSLGVLLLASVLMAQEKAKEVTLKGQILCAHCSLGQGDKCQTAIQVKEGDKLVTYYLDDKGAAESHHEPVCGGAKKEGTVVGKLEQRDGKNFVKPTKVEYVKK